MKKREIFFCSYNHFIYVSKIGESFSQAKQMQCGHVKPGDIVWLIPSSNENIVPVSVVRRTIEKLEGIYSPITKSGNIIVNDISFSCYGYPLPSQKIANWIYYPVSLWYELKNFFGIIERIPEEQRMDAEVYPVRGTILDYFVEQAKVMMVLYQKY